MSVMLAMEGPIGVAFLTMVTVLMIVGVVALCRKFCCKSAVNYTAVNHGLDEEEIAFKKSMEAQHGDDIDELFNFSGQEELEFDTNDLDNLEMLQMYRSHLGVPSTTGSIETGLGKEDRNGGGRNNDGRGGDTERSGGGTGAYLGDAVREAEDLEALLDGGGYCDNGGGRGAGGRAERNGGESMEGGNSGAGKGGPA